MSYWRFIIALALCLFVASAALAQQEKLIELMQTVMKLSQEGEYTEATKVAEEALNLAEKTLGPGHSHVAASLDSLAGLYMFQKRYADAEPLCKRSLAINEKALGPDHPDVAKSLNLLAALYRKIGKEEEASKLEERAQKIKSQSGSH